MKENYEKKIKREKDYYEKKQNKNKNKEKKRDYGKKFYRNLSDGKKGNFIS